MGLERTTTMTTKAISNSTRNVSQTPPIFYSQASIVGQTCLLILMIIAAFLGNSLVIGAVWFCRKLRKSTNFFIVSLAVSDVLIAVTIMPFRIHHNLHRMVWNLGPDVCQLWVFMDFLVSSASTANVALIAIDRLLALSYPFRYPQLVSGRRSAMAIALVWCYAVFLAGLSFKGWSRDATLDHHPACTKLDKTYYSFATLLGIFFPLVILVVAYSLVFRLAFRQALMIKSHSVGKLSSREKENGNKKVKNKGERSTQARLLIRELKATKTLMIVVGTFLVCWFPLFILLLVAQHCPKCIGQTLSPTWQEIIGTTFVYTLPRLNSALNPIIYSVFNREFRSGVCLLCSKIASFFPHPSVVRGTVFPGRRGGLCGPRADSESTSDNSAAYEPATEPYYGWSTNEANSRSPSMFTFKNFEACYHETSV